MATLPCFTTAASLLAVGALDGARAKKVCNGGGLFFLHI